MKVTSPRVIVCDFDGTITGEDIGNIVLNRFSGGVWETFDKEFINGAIGSKSAYKKVLPFLQGSKEDVEAFIYENFNLDEDFPIFVQNCFRFGDIPLILSDGFDIYIRILLQKKGLDKKILYRANHWGFRKKKAFFSFPFFNKGCQHKGGGCGNCKTSHLIQIKHSSLLKAGPRKDGDQAGFESSFPPIRDFQTKGKRDVCYKTIIYIGNGYSDRCPISKADQVLAKDRLREFCIREKIAFQPFRCFKDVNRILFG